MKHLFLVLAILGLIGCDRIHVDDDMDESNFHLDIFPQISRENDLNGPYAAGGEVVFSVHGAGDEQGWTFTSSDASVIRFMDFDESAKTGTAETLEAGEATVRLVDADGDIVESFEIVVGRVAEARITSNIMLGTTTMPIGDEVVIVENGRATFNVSFYDEEGDELRGRDILEARGESTTGMESFFEFNTWLRVEPHPPGMYTHTLWVDGQEVGQLNVRVVPASDVVSLRLLGDETGAEEDAFLAVRAVGVTEEASVVYGVNPLWTIDGVRLQARRTLSLPVPARDLYTYQYNAEIPQELTIQSVGSDIQYSMTVHGATGYVGNSNAGTCAIGQGSAAGLWAPCGVALCLMWRRRRR